MKTALDSNWVSKVRKAWKAQIRIPTIMDAGDALAYLTGLMDWLDQLSEDIQFSRGFYQIPREGPQSIPSRLKSKVLGELEATRDILIDVRERIQSNVRAMDPTSLDYRLSGAYLYEHFQKEDPKSPLRAFHKSVRIILQEAVGNADKALSRRMLGAISSYLKKYKHEIDFGQIDLEFSVGKLKVVYQDVPKKPAPNDRYPAPEAYATQLQKALAALQKAGLGYLWYGDMYIRCKDCGGENHLGAQFGVGAHYFSRKDAIRVYSNPTNGLPKLIIHELGHRYYYRFMSQADRAKFDSYFAGGDAPTAVMDVVMSYVGIMSREHRKLLVGIDNRPEDIQLLVRWYFDQMSPGDQKKVQGWLKGVPATSEYGRTISSEDFAEVFSAYVTRQGLTRDQLERFKSFLGRTNRMAYKNMATRIAARWRVSRLQGNT